MTPTRISVERVDGRVRARFSSGLLRPQLVHSPTGWCRIGLLATTALLLGGDTVELEVRVGPHARLDLFDVAGTVALDGRGAGCRWLVTVQVAEGAVLHFSGLPFVVADGAVVARRLHMDLAATGRALLRDTVVLGRSGEAGGRVQNRTSITVDGRLICLEDQNLDPDLRNLPGMLGGYRVLDSITALGVPRPVVATHRQLSHFDLVDGAGTVSRYLGEDLAPSPLHRAWRDVEPGFPSSS